MPVLDTNLVQFCIKMLNLLSVSNFTFHFSLQVSQSVVEDNPHKTPGNSFGGCDVKC